MDLQQTKKRDPRNLPVMHYKAGVTLSWNQCEKLRFTTFGLVGCK